MGYYDDDMVQKLKETIQAQQAQLEALAESPSKHSVVLRVRPKGDKALVLMGNEAMEVLIPKRLRGTIKAGHYSIHNGMTGALVGLSDDVTGPGGIATVNAMLDTGQVEVQTDGGQARVVYLSPYVKGEIKPGVRVQLDKGENLIILNLGPDKRGFTIPERIDVRWNDIGGLEEAKRELREAIELPVKMPDLFERYGHKPAKGILLYGPPGCGKTLLAKASVGSLADLHGEDAAASGFIYVKGPEVLSTWVGQAEATIRSLFTRAREHFKEKGFPAVVFIDEADAILGARGDGRTGSMSHTIVPQFLSEMDGLETTGAPIVLLATNRPDTLDSAVVRDGRVDRKIRITRPGQKDVQDIAKLNLRHRPVKDDDLHKYVAQGIFSEDRKLYRFKAVDGSEHHMTLGHVVNGAMVAGIVSRATSKAMQREIESGKLSSIVRDDIDLAISENVQQMRDVNLKPEVDEFIEASKVQFTHMERV